MNKATLRLSSFFSLAIPFSLLLGIVLFSRSVYFESQSELISQYIILDLLITIPVIYFLLIRSTAIPKITVIPMLILGMLVGYNALPGDQHFYLDQFKTYIFPLIELGVLAYVVYKIRKAVKAYQLHKKNDLDFYDIMRQTCKEIVPGRMSEFLLSEISVFYYGFLNWKKYDDKEGQFTYHKRSGSQALFGALIFIILVETFAVHVLLVRWSSLAATLLSILSIYTAIQFLGFSRSLSKRPILIRDDKLYLRYGILSEVVIPLGEIDSIELSRKPIKKEDEIQKLSLLGEMESHNVIIHCKKLQVLNGIYGIRKNFKSIAFHLDEKEGFKSQIDRCLMILNN